MRAREQNGIWPASLFLLHQGSIDPAFVFGFAAWSQAKLNKFGKTGIGLNK